MLSTASLRPRHRPLVRLLSAEPHIPTASPQPPPTAPRLPRARFSPSPRSPNASHVPSASNPPFRAPFNLPHLPPTFGSNQILSVAPSTRALLEEIVGTFRAPIRYAFAYGSGVFEQDGNSSPNQKPMLDFIFAVNHPAHWHSINLTQNPSHYALHARLLGSSFVSRVQQVSPGVWFNAYVPMSGATIKYGVTTVDALCSDLLTWNSLYLSGRMHKPIRIIKDDARVRLTQQVNLASAARTALLTLPEKFTEQELYEQLAGFSYGGDPRMMFAENPDKIRNITKPQQPQFRELYHRLMSNLPGVHWPADSSIIEQDVAANARAIHLRKLPSGLLKRTEQRYAAHFQSTGVQVTKESDPSAFWTKVAGDAELSKHIAEDLRAIVRWPATVQTAKGLVSAGLGKSIKYAVRKVGKWWAGGRTSGSPGNS